MPKEFSARSLSLTSQESYSAVIIADLVAEVQQEPEINHRNINLIKEENCEKVPPSSVLADGADKLNINDSKTNGTNISKGVILNALQFGQNDTKLKADSGNVMTTVSQIPNNDASKKASNFKEEFKQMSALRKVAFGFSFLPSIMFVLCFAVIFPCEKILPCLHEQWSITLNGTEITSNVMIPQSIIFTFVNNFGSGLRCISESSGETKWEKTLKAPAKFSACRKSAYTDKQFCLFMDDSGIDIFNPSNGKEISHHPLTTTQIPPPIILSNCDKYGFEEVAVASTESRTPVILEVISNRSISVSDCDSVPSVLLSWQRLNETDILFICKRGENETLLRISQNEWCSSEKKPKIERSTLVSKANGILTQSKILPTGDNLLVWSQGEVAMIKPDGQLLWSFITSNHSSKNRFLFSGVQKDISEVFLYSSDILSNLQITRLNAENGSLIQTKSIPNTELSEAKFVKGESRNFLVGVKKQFTASLKNKAVTQIKEISATVISILTKENTSIVSSNSSSTIQEEISLMELDGTNVHTLQSRQISYSEGDSYSTELIVETKGGKENEEYLKAYLLRKPKASPRKESTTLKTISLSNWDISSTKSSQCVWK